MTPMPENDPPGTGVETVTVAQASQPTYAGVRVGIVIAGLNNGIPMVRLAIRNDEESTMVDLREGESAALFDRGTVTVDAVHPRVTEEERDRVTLTFRPETP